MRVLLADKAPTFRVESGTLFSVRLTPVQGEIGRFIAHSDTRFYCPTCGVKFTRKKDNVCQRCGTVADSVTYMVDVAENNGRTKCSCESFTCHKRDEQPQDVLLAPCKHGNAALFLFGYLKARALAAMNGKGSGP
jgi:hypothetical protein